MKRVSIKIFDANNNLEGALDLYDDGNFPLSITKGVSNIDNIRERLGTYSKTFTIPATKNNNNILGDLFIVNINKDNGNLLDKKTCKVVVNEVEVETGYIKVTSVLGSYQPVEYELVFFGDATDWASDADALTIDSITFRNNTQTFDMTNIRSIQAQTIATTDIQYPYVNRGVITNAGGTISDNDFRPTLYLKSIIERGLNEIGWKLSSDFMNTTNFKNLVCDISGAFEYNDTTLQQSKTKVGLLSNLNSAAARGVITWDDESGQPTFEDTNNNNSTFTGQYTAPFTGTYKIEVYIKTNAPSTAPTQDITYQIVQNYDLVNLTGNILTSVTRQYTSAFDHKFNLTVNLNAGDTITTVYLKNIGPNLSIATTASYSDISLAATVTSGGTYQINNIIPTDISLLDVINDVSRMFNLYYWTDTRTKTIYVEPRDDFYKDNSEAIDWTDKVSMNPPYEITFATDYSRSYDLRYKDDSNDGWLERWNRVNKLTYGEYNHTFSNRFPKGSGAIELSVFAPTYSIEDIQGNPSSVNLDDQPVVARIWEEYDIETNPPNEVEDYLPRIYNYVYGGQLNENGGNRSMDLDINGLVTSTTVLPIAITETYKGAVAPINLNFAGVGGLADEYYLKTLNTVEKATKLKAWFKLTALDVQYFDFRKPILLSAIGDVSGVYLVEKIEDFNYIEEGLTLVHLLENKNFGKATLGIGGVNNPQDNLKKSNEEPNPIYIDVAGEIQPVFSYVNGNLELVFKDVADA